MMIDPAVLFERRQAYPHPAARERLDRLVGIDEQKEKLAKILGLLVNPSGLRGWSDRYHPDAALFIDTVLHRPPLVILAGDVGSGKTELADCSIHSRRDASYPISCRCGPDTARGAPV